MDTRKDAHVRLAKPNTRVVIAFGRDREDASRANGSCSPEIVKCRNALTHHVVLTTVVRPTAACPIKRRLSSLPYGDLYLVPCSSCLSRRQTVLSL